MIENLPIALFINSLLCIGVFYSTRPGYLLESIADAYDSIADRSNILMFLRKPLFACIPCTASFWGLAFLLVFQPIELTYGLIYQAPMYMLCLMGMNMLLNGVIRTGNALNSIVNHAIKEGKWL